MPAVGTGLKIQILLWSATVVLWLIIDFVASDRLLGYVTQLSMFSWLIGLLCLYGNRGYWMKMAAHRRRSNKGWKMTTKVTLATVFCFFLLPVLGAYLFATLILPSFITMAIGKQGSRILIVEKLKTSHGGGYKGRGGTSRLYAHFNGGSFMNSTVRASKINSDRKLNVGDKVLVTGKASWAGIFLEQIDVVPE